MQRIESQRNNVWLFFIGLFAYYAIILKCVNEALIKFQFWQRGIVKLQEDSPNVACIHLWDDEFSAYKLKTYQPHSWSPFEKSKMSIFSAESNVNKRLNSKVGIASGHRSLLRWTVGEKQMDYHNLQSKITPTESVH